MKWENRGINVIEQENIPKFNKLDDTVTPLRLLDFFSIVMMFTRNKTTKIHATMPRRQYTVPSGKNQNVKC